MGGLAQGGHAPVATFLLAGIAILVGGIYLDSLYGLMPLAGVLCLMVSVFFANFGDIVRTTAVVHLGISVVIVRSFIRATFQNTGTSVAVIVDV